MTAVPRAKLRGRKGNNYWPAWDFEYMLHVTVETAECSCSPDVPFRAGTNRAPTTIVCWGNVGIVEKKTGNDYLGLNIEYYRGSIGIMENQMKNQMETTRG